MKQFFINWYNKYFIDNFDLDAANRAQIFSWQQILLCLTILTVFIVILIILSKCSNKAQTIALYVFASLILILEILRFLWLGIVRYNGWSKFIFHFNLCNILAIFIPLSILVIRKRTCYAASFVLGLVGGIAVIIYPRDVIAGYYLLHVLVVQSLISHTLFIVVAVLLVMTKKYEISYKKDWWRCGLVFFGFTILAKIMTILYNGEENFLFMYELDFAGLNFMPFWAYYPIIVALGFGVSFILLYVIEKVLNKIKKRQNKNNLYVIG